MSKHALFDLIPVEDGHRLDILKNRGLPRFFGGLNKAKHIE